MTLTASRQKLQACRFGECLQPQRENLIQANRTDCLNRATIRALTAKNERMPGASRVSQDQARQAILPRPGLSFMSGIRYYYRDE